jgi:hypothetical protein
MLTGVDSIRVLSPEVLAVAQVLNFAKLLCVGCGNSFVDSFSLPILDEDAGDWNGVLTGVAHEGLGVYMTEDVVVFDDVYASEACVRAARSSLVLQ